MARTPKTVRGFSTGNSIPSSTPKYQGPNFGVAGWTVERGRVWWGWNRTPQVVSGSTHLGWAGHLGFGFFETGTVIPGPESTTAGDVWVHWQPVSPQDQAAQSVWYDAGAPASYEWTFHAGYFEWKTPRTAPGAGMDLWACWDIPSTPGAGDTFNWSWVIQYLEL